MEPFRSAISDIAFKLDRRLFIAGLGGSAISIVAPNWALRKCQAEPITALAVAGTLAAEAAKAAGGWAIKRYLDKRFPTPDLGEQSLKDIGKVVKKQIDQSELQKCRDDILALEQSLREYSNAPVTSKDRIELATDASQRLVSRLQGFELAGQDYFHLAATLRLCVLEERFKSSGDDGELKNFKERLGDYLDWSDHLENTWEERHDDSWGPPVMSPDMVEVGTFGDYRHYEKFQVWRYLRDGHWHPLTSTAELEEIDPKDELREQSAKKRRNEDKIQVASLAARVNWDALIQPSYDAMYATYIHPMRKIRECWSQMGTRMLGDGFVPYQPRIKPRLNLLSTAEFKGQIRLQPTASVYKYWFLDFDDHGKIRGHGHDAISSNLIIAKPKGLGTVWKIKHDRDGFTLQATAGGFRDWYLGVDSDADAQHAPHTRYANNLLLAARRRDDSNWKVTHVEKGVLLQPTVGRFKDWYLDYEDPSEISTDGRFDVSHNLMLAEARGSVLNGVLIQSNSESAPHLVFSLLARLASQSDNHRMASDGPFQGSLVPKFQ